MKNIYYNSEGYLSIEGIDTRLLIEKYPTPFYAYSTNEIIGNCRDVHQCAASLELMPCYALKANYNPSLIKIIRDMNFGADVVSGGELYFALNNGIDPQKIVFAGVGKNEEEITLAIQHGIHSINIESKSELERIKTVAQQLKKKIVVAIRVNPDIDAKTHPYISTGLHSSKFGVSREMAIKLYNNARMSDYLDPCGVHVHIGSQIEETGPYLETVHFLKNFVSQLENMGITISYLDLGGGIGINYPDLINERNESTTFIKKILPSLLKPFENEKRKILVELGRSIIGSAGVLLTKILYIKETPQKKFVIVDAAMNNLIRPSLYNAYHQILPVNAGAGSTEVVDVVGPVCETADFFAKDRELPVCREGDYLVITGAGAYGQALASNYNLRSTAAEYLIEEDQIHTIFKGESIEDIALKFKS
jgi:diaminopimelate decarboxylase